jgi:hypothetical protein
MRSIPLAVLLLLSALAWAGTTPNPAEYTVNVHVGASYMVSERAFNLYVQKLDAVIDGKKYELESEASGWYWHLATTKRRSLKMSTREPMILFKSTSFCFPTKRQGSSLWSGRWSEFA